jgi:hypothetical protein
MPTSPVTPHQNGKPMSAAARTLVIQCRELAKVRMTKTLSDAVAHVEEDLLRLSIVCEVKTEKQVLEDAMMKMRQSREVLARAFERDFVVVFDRLTAAIEGRDASALNKTAELTLDQLTLVESSDLDEELIVTDLARESKGHIDAQQLLGIRARISHLFGTDILEDQRNPLAPEAIWEAVRLACGKVQGDFAVKRSLLAAFRPYVVRGIGAAYAEVNQSLVAHDVLPKIKHSVRRVGSEGSHGSHGSHWANTSQTLPTWPQMGVTQPVMAYPPMGTSQPVTAYPPHPMAVSQPLGAYAQPGAGGLAVSQAMRAEGLMGGPGTNTTQQLAVHHLLSAGVPGVGGEVGTPGLVERTDLATALTNTLDAPPAARRLVARMLAEPGRYAFEPVIQQPATPQLVSSLTHLQSAPAFGVPGTNYLAGLDATVRAQSSAIDLLTIEFVNIVFDHILNDQSIPETVKAHIARLQIVAVKAAILDRTFFARRDHPMRRLLDRIATAGVDPEIDPAPDGAFVAGLRSIVNHIVNDFRDDLGIFPQAEAQLETLIGRVSLSQSSEFRSTAATLEEKERAEVAHTSALAEIRRRVGGQTPGYLREFLDAWWSQVLVQAQLKELPGEDSWTHRLSVVDALVWSTAPLTRSGEVSQLATMLPSLMRNIARGMTAVDMPEAERRSFFDALMQTHTANIADAKARRLEMTQPMAVPTPAALAAAAVTLAPPPVVESTPEPEPVPDYYAHAVTALERGSLVEFMDGETAVRSKLAWISPGQTIYLFTSSTANARSLGPKALADAFREGRARVLDATEGLMDRVVRSVVSEAVPLAA